MSIASRIEAIEEHLTDDYSVLTLAGADLTGVNKNILNLKLTWQERLLYFMNNGTQVVWNNWNKVSGTGTSLTLNNTEEAPISLTYKGNTSQTGTPTPTSPIPVQVVSGDNSINVCGKNLFNPNTMVKGRLDNGVIGYASDTTSLTNTDNSISFTTSTGWRGATTDFIKRKSGAFVLIKCVYDNNNLSPNVVFYDKDKNFITNKSVATQDYGWRASNEVSNAEYIRITFMLSASGSVTISNPQVEFGTEPSTYEAFKGASYPINLGVASAINFASSFSSHPAGGGYSTYKLKDDNSIEYVSGSSGYGWSYANSQLKATLKAGTYTVTSNNQLIKIYNSSGTNIIDASSANNFIATFTLSEDTQIGIGCKPDTTTGACYITINEGSKAQHISTTPIQLLHIPNTDYYDKIDKSTGKNLFNPNIEINSTYNSSIATALSNFKTTGKYATGYTSNGTSLSNNANYVTSFTPCQNGVTYTINNTYSAGANFSMVCFLDDNGNVINHNSGWSNNAYTHTATSEEKYIMCGINMNDSGVDYRNWVMINVGETALPYEPYGTGWYLKKEIGKVVLNGSENWADYTTQYTNYYTSYCTTKHFGQTGNMLSADKFMINNFQSQGADFSAEKQFIASSLYAIYLKISSSIVSTANDLKTWLSSNNTTVYYVLNTPTYTLIEDSTLISQLEALKKSYENVTNISQVNNDLPFELDVTALEVMN